MAKCGCELEVLVSFLFLLRRISIRARFRSDLMQSPAIRCGAMHVPLRVVAQILPFH